MATPFSPPRSSGPELQVYALPTGQLTHPDRWLFEDGDPDLYKVRHPYPDYSFLITHPTGKNILFDLGLRSDLENVPKLIRGGYPIIEPKVHEDAFDILSRGPVKPEAIDAVIFSHIHFDHVGDCTKFPKSQMVAGPGSRKAASPGFPVDPKSGFDSNLINHPHYHELSWETDEWKALGPFERAHDYFGDGSLYLLDTPGHLVGHLGALVKTGNDEWVFMGGDCCHHRSLLVGSRPMSVTLGPAGQNSFHFDIPAAQSTIAKIRELNMTGQVFVALAHDSYLVDKMPEYPNSLNGWKTSEWKKGLDTILRNAYGTEYTCMMG